MKFLELFSGNADITKELIKRGHSCISVDYDPNKKADICTDVYALTDAFLSQFDCIWLSPDCTTYSIAGHGLHRSKGGIAVSKYAEQCDIMNSQLINRLIKLDIPFIIENPRGFLRHKPFMSHLDRITIYYSTYGTIYTKPTDLWSNRKEALNYFNTTTTKGNKQLQEVTCSKQFLKRCKIPDALLNDICDAMIGACQNG